jgi:hypothetical protein
MNFLIVQKMLPSVKHQWLTPVILATQEAEIRRIKVRSQPGQIVHKTLFGKIPSQKRAGGVTQGIGPEFKQQNKTKQNKTGFSSHNCFITSNFYYFLIGQFLKSCFFFIIITLLLLYDTLRDVRCFALEFK